MAQYQHITATTQIKPSAGKLKGIFVASASNTPQITVYDTKDGGTTGNTLAGTFVPAAGGMYLNIGDETAIFFNRGLYIVISGTVDATVLFE